jgi:predicted porin
MKHRTTICFAAATMACAQQATGSVTIYGLVDEGVEYVHGSNGATARR